VLIQSHSAALGLAFYNGKMFPADYQGDAFISLHGSWNRAEPTGYKIVRVRMKNGKPVSGYDDFITGWFTDGKVWGRPVGLLVIQDGSLLIVDDGGKRIWRVTYGN
jgi:glucose/arabinose dehydrogenase